MKFRRAFLVALLAAAPVGAANPARPTVLLPKGVELALPKQPGVAARWAAPPTNRPPPAATAFDVAPNGDPWIAYGKTLFNAGRLGALGVDQTFQDIAWLDNGLLLLGNGRSAGYLVGVRPKGTKPAVMRAVFKPLWRLPRPNTRLFAGHGTVVYMAGANPATKKHEVYVVRVQNRRAFVKKIFESAAPVAWVAGDGRDTWIAVGRVVARLDLQTRRAEPVFAHPRETVREFAHSPTAGFVYATASGLGHYKDGLHVQFMKGKDLRPRLRDDSLFVLLPGGNGVLRVDGVAKFKAPRRGGASAR